MPKRIIVVLIIVIAFGVFMFSSLMRSCSPHVDFDRAKTGEYVQVYGFIQTDNIRFDSSSLILSFSLEDESGATMPVEYGGVVPANFEYAQEATCAGHWQDGKFVADRLLLKCPSKYEGQVGDDTLYQFYDEDKDI